MITEEQEKAYLDSMGLSCPYCKSDAIEGEQWNGDTATQYIRCNDCGRQWADCYELTGIIELED